MHPILRLHEDVLSNDGALRVELPALPRMIFIVHGTATIAAVPGATAKPGTAKRR